MTARKKKFIQEFSTNLRLANKVRRTGATRAPYCQLAETFI